jgi:hypothetical protein
MIVVSLGESYVNSEDEGGTRDAVAPRLEVDRLGSRLCLVSFWSAGRDLPNTSSSEHFGSLVNAVKGEHSDTDVLAEGAAITSGGTANSFARTGKDNSGHARTRQSRVGQAKKDRSD